jgi:chromosome segregation ATPase
MTTAEYFFTPEEALAAGRAVSTTVVQQGAAMFGSVRRKLERTQAALTAVLAERDAYLTQRDIALGERNEFLRQRDAHLRERDQAVQDLDELHAQVSGSSTVLARALAERNTYLEQRDQAYREIDGLSRERNELKSELERLKSAARA